MDVENTSTAASTRGTTSPTDSVAKLTSMASAEEGVQNPLGNLESPVSAANAISPPDTFNISLLPVKASDDISRQARDFSDLSDPAVVRAICHEEIPGWALFDAEQNIQVAQIMAGLTNQLFKVELVPGGDKTEQDVAAMARRTVLFRVYGRNASDLYDTSLELKRFKMLAKRGVAPKLIAEFAGGRIEEWLFGPCLSIGDMANPSVICALATILARLHMIQDTAPEFSTVMSPTPCVWTNLERWIRKSLRLLALARTSCGVHPLTGARQTAQNPAAICRRCTAEIEEALDANNANASASASASPSPSASANALAEPATALNADHMEMTSCGSTMTPEFLATDTVGPAATCDSPGDILSTEGRMKSMVSHYDLEEKHVYLRRLESLQLDKLAREAEQLLDWCVTGEHVVASPALQPCFCHNDLQENNIMVTGTRLRLIDFEYSDTNYPAADIANYLWESTCDYGLQEFPFYSIAAGVGSFPNEEVVKMFAAVYLSERERRSVMPSMTEHIAPFVHAIWRFVLANHLAWGFWSVIRAPQAPTTSDFDFVSYAEARFSGYWKWKAHLVDLGLLGSHGKADQSRGAARGEYQRSSTAT